MNFKPKNIIPYELKIFNLHNYLKIEKRSTITY